jgi:hypothetical protein
MTEGIKHDKGKLRYDLVPPIAFQGDAEVLTFGADIYGERNWENGIDTGRLFAAAMRHLIAWRRGETINEESGLHHLKHARVNLVMIMVMEENARPQAAIGQ